MEADAGDEDEAKPFRVKIKEISSRGVKEVSSNSEKPQSRQSSSEDKSKSSISSSSSPSSSSSSSSSSHSGSSHKTSIIKTSNSPSHKSEVQGSEEDEFHKMRMTFMNQNYPEEMKHQLHDRKKPNLKVAISRNDANPHPPSKHGNRHTQSEPKSASENYQMKKKSLTIA
mmetsp:Transcript_22990/g.35507  ORF Transcript_22990/g.35507 Transcript_22990/m.35507 type:complete len:170 (+) Transcript_22990:1645-2154(+)